MIRHNFFAIFLMLSIFLGCNINAKKENIPIIGFLDAFEDATLAQAKQGFIMALKDHGFSEDRQTLKIIYRNAQGDIPTLVQSTDYFISEGVDLIAANPTISTITAVQKTKTIPVFMMVSPSPELSKLTDAHGKAPANLYGVYETLEYIDTSVALIKTILPMLKKLGAIYNQSEPQSLLALEHLHKKAEQLGIQVVASPANNSSETQLVVQSLLNDKIDAFFALPDNTVFASFEVLIKSCEDAKIPVFTSEAGLVKRGAIAAFGADMYQWGYQSGLQAAQFLKNKNAVGLKPELVKVRKRLFNPVTAKKFNIQFQNDFSPVQ